MLAHLKTAQLVHVGFPYYGETRNNTFSCRGEHRAACRLENEENALYKHCQLENNGMQAEFSMRVAGRFQVVW